MNIGNYDYEIKFGLARITSYNGNEETVIIPPKLDKYNVFAVEAGAFTGNDSVKKVVFPSTIGKTFPKTFIGCPNLEEIEFSSYVDDFSEQSIVYECYNFKKFSTESTRLACQIERVYSNHNVDIACSKDFKIEVLDEEAKTAKLVKVRMRSDELIMPDEVDGYKITELGFNLSAFPKRKITELKFPKFLKFIPAYFAYEYKHTLKKVIFNENLEKICTRAFWRTKTNDTLVVPKNVSEIEDEALLSSYWDQRDVVFEIDSKLSKLGKSAFAGCVVDFNGLSFAVPEYGFCETTVLNFKFNQTEFPAYVCKGAKFGKNVTGLDKIEFLGKYAFYDSRIEDATSLPREFVLDLNQVDKIEDYAIYNSIFTKLILKKDSVLNSNLFRGCNFREIVFPEDFIGTEIPERCFYDICSLKKVVLSKSIKIIGKEAFSCCPIEEINLEYVEEIREKAFCGSHLKKFYAYKALKVLEAYAFHRNTLLESVEFDEDCEITTLSKYLFYDCANLSSVKLSSKITKLDAYVFGGCNITEFVSDVITELGFGCFEDCDELVKVYLPNVTSIADCAFERCKKLFDILFGKLVSIGSNAFRYCSEITKFVIDDGCQDIGDGAFEYTNITEAIIPDSVTHLGRNVYNGCSITKFILGKGVKTVYYSTIPTRYLEELDLGAVEVLENNALCNLRVLKKLIIPSTCTRIEKDAITSAEELCEAYIYGTLEEVPRGLFNFCYKLTEIHTDDIKSGRVLVSRKNTSINKIVPISPNVKIRTRKKKSAEA